MKGDLAPGVLPGLLRHTYVNRKSGLIHFTRAGERRSVRVHNGHIVHAETSAPEERFGRLLVRLSLLSERDQTRAAEIALQAGKRLGEVILEKGLMTRDRLEDALALHVREVLAGVFTWKEGSYEFAESDTGPPPAGEATLKVNTGELILEAVRRIEDPEAIRRGLGNLDRLLVPAKDPFFRFQRITLTPTDGYVLSRIDGTLSASDVLQLIHLPTEDTQRTLFALLCTGVIEYLPPRTAAASEPLPPSPSLRDVGGRVGRYQIAEVLGKGAMGIVYRARDTVLERDVALKIMAPAAADDPDLKERFEREAKAVARLAHPNIVTVFDLGTHTDGSPYIAMELLRGVDLNRLLRQGPPLSLPRKLQIVVQVLAGLEHAHRQEIVHRDIKPANIFVQEDGTVRIMDFGVARLGAGSMTEAGTVMGTANYMSPEQALGRKVDGRSDLFSVGSLLFELVTGKRPYESDTAVSTLYKIIHQDPPYDAIPSIGEHAPLQSILRKALARNPDERYQTAGEFALALTEGIQARTLSP